MPSILLAKLKDGKKGISIEQPGLPQFVMSILSSHFDGSMSTEYTTNDPWLRETVPQEVIAVLKKLRRNNRPLGIIVYGRSEDKYGGTRADHLNCDCIPEDFPIIEGALAVHFHGKFYLLAQWRGDERAPTPIPEMKRIIQEKFNRRINPELRVLREFDQAPFSFAP